MLTATHGLDLQRLTDLSRMAAERAAVVAQWRFEEAFETARATSEQLDGVWLLDAD